MELTPNILARALAPLRRRILLLVGRAVLTAVSTAQTTQRVQITGLKGETHAGVPHYQPHGFLAVPLEGAYAVMLYQGGDRGAGIAIVVDDPRHRPKGWLAGEVGLYDHLGKFIRLRADGTIEVNAPKVVVNSPDVSLGAEGGPAVARIGDNVQVGSGSSAGLWPIVEGSGKVTAAD